MLNDVKEVEDAWHELLVLVVIRIDVPDSHGACVVLLLEEVGRSSSPAKETDPALCIVLLKTGGQESPDSIDIEQPVEVGDHVLNPKDNALTSPALPEEENREDVEPGIESSHGLGGRNPTIGQPAPFFLTFFFVLGLLGFDDLGNIARLGFASAAYHSLKGSFDCSNNKELIFVVLVVLLKVATLELVSDHVWHDDLDQ